MCAAIAGAEADAKKGEHVILTVAGAPADRARIVAQAREQGVAEILLPARVVALDRIPLLTWGKTDHPALARRLAALDMPKAA